LQERQHPVVGVKNFDVADLRELKSTAGESMPACNQVLYHLRERAIEHTVIPWCERHNVAVVAYSPFGHGQSSDPRSPGGRVLRVIAEAHRATPGQIALRFLLRWPTMFTGPKASNPEHVEENANAADVQLSEVEINRIDNAFPLGSPPRELPML
jgi:diketogulonate reductase-like aldo/keto reductase